MYLIWHIYASVARARFGVSFEGEIWERCRLPISSHSAFSAVLERLVVNSRSVIGRIASVFCLSWLPMSLQGSAIAIGVCPADNHAPVDRKAFHSLSQRTDSAASLSRFFVRSTPALRLRGSMVRAEKMLDTVDLHEVLIKGANSMRVTGADLLNVGPNSLSETTGPNRSTQSRILSWQTVQSRALGADFAFLSERGKRYVHHHGQIDFDFSRRFEVQNGF